MKIDPANPLPYARPEVDFSTPEQKLTFDLINRLNQISSKQYPTDESLRARMQSYELAYRMQTSVPDVIRFDGETQETQDLYGFDDPTTHPFGMHLLAARRFAERGVRVIQIMHGAGAAGARDWPSHRQHTKATRHAKG